MRYRHIYFMTILNTVMVFHSHLTCMASAAPSSPNSNLSWGDMDDFLKFMKNYETYSRIISQSRSKTRNRILDIPMTMVSNQSINITNLPRNNVKKIIKFCVTNLFIFHHNVGSRVKFY